jgi:hypothetical protein
MTALDKDDNRRRKAGEVEKTALGTLFGPFNRTHPHPTSASAAKLVCLIPVQDLHCTASQAE